MQSFEKRPGFAGIQMLLALLLALTLANRGSAAEEGQDVVDGRAAEAAYHEGGDSHGAAHDLGHGDAGPNLENAAEFRGDMAIYTFVVFLLLLAILGKFAWPAITAALEERERNIEENIAAAAAKHEEAKKLLAEHEARLAETSGEVRELMEEARRDAERAKAQILVEAKKAASAERDRAIREVDMATEAAMQRLAETSANLAVDLAGKVVRTHITSDQQSQLVRDALARLAKSSPSDN
jgi:F-type H+-transporting ATPase subunit b